MTTKLRTLIINKPYTFITEHHRERCLIILLYSDHCRFCKNFLPIWNNTAAKWLSITENYPNEEKESLPTIAQLNGDLHSEFLKPFNNSAYPKLLFYKQGQCDRRLSIVTELRDVPRTVQELLDTFESFRLSEKQRRSRHPSSVNLQKQLSDEPPEGTQHLEITVDSPIPNKIEDVPIHLRTWKSQAQSLLFRRKVGIFTFRSLLQFDRLSKWVHSKQQSKK